MKPFAIVFINDEGAIPFDKAIASETSVGEHLMILASARRCSGDGF
jgi:hypothetical protein